MSEKFFLHQTFTEKILKFEYVDMPDVTAGYGWLSDLIVIFICIFKYYYMFEALYLHQTFTNMLRRTLEMKN